MKRAKRATIYVAAGLFVAAAAAKLLFPARTSETIRTVEESFHRADYRTEETVAGVTEAADDAAIPVTVTINAAEFLGLTEPAGTEELSPAVEEAMAAFMEEQQPFVDLGVPANVSYDAPMPKFSFVQPLSARVSSDFGYRLHPIDNETKFHYGMDLVRECVGGFYQGTYLKCVLILLLMCVIFFIIGITLYYPAKKLNEIIAKSKEASGVM